MGFQVPIFCSVSYSSSIAFLQSSWSGQQLVASTNEVGSSPFLSAISATTANSLSRSNNSTYKAIIHSDVLFMVSGRDEGTCTPQGMRELPDKMEMMLNHQEYPGYAG